MFTDSHCHLTFPELAGDMPGVRAAMAAARVTRALCISTTMEEFPSVQALATEYDNFWASAGVHPDSEDVHEPSVAELVAATQMPKVVAIGETGLDYYQMEERKGGRGIADMEWQRERFRTHIRAALLALLAQDRQRVVGRGAGSAGGVFHCFTETREVARAALDLGFYVSLSGIVTFKNARELHEVATLIPDDRLLIETDSPYLAPVPYRGKINTPAYVPHVAARLAELRGTSAEHIGELTSANFTRLFKRVAS